MNYADTMNKAEMLIKLAESERRGREYGRRESDHKLQDLARFLKLATDLLAQSIEIIERGTFEAANINTLKVGLSMLEGFNNDDPHSDSVPDSGRSNGSCAGCGNCQG